MGIRSTVYECDWCKIEFYYDENKFKPMYDFTNFRIGFGDVKESLWPDGESYCICEECWNKIKPKGENDGD